MRLYTLFGILCFSVSCFAITQSGTLKTIARANRQSVALSGAVIRVRGSHNAVETQSDGSFSLLLPNRQNGDAIVISSIVLSGYEPANSDMVGKPIACSDIVPLEILMVNREELQQEKEAIAQKARENVEIYYENKVSELEKRLAAGEIAQAEYQQQLGLLEQKYEQFEPLLELMADKYARTDYSQLTSTDISINAAIEGGNLDEAERLIHSKGDFAQREQELQAEQERNQQTEQLLREAQEKLQTMQQTTRERMKQLAEDYYHLHSIHLTRFQNDSAGFYLCKCADTDTTNIDYQIQAGQFMKNMLAEYSIALPYFARAERMTDKESLNKAIVTHELGHTYFKLKDYDKAEQYYQLSLNIRQDTRGKEHPEEVAETMSQLGNLYSMKKDYKTALQYHQQTLKIREKYYGSNSRQVAVTLGNIAYIYFFEGKLDKALQNYERIEKIHQNNSDIPKREAADNYNNLARIYFKLNALDKSLQYFGKAYEIYLNVYGAKHPLTQSTEKNITYIKQL